MLTNKNTKKSLYDLRNDTNLGHEKGYSVFKNELGIIHALPCVSNNLAPTSIIMDTGKTTSGGNIIGAFHTHPDAGSTSTYPMFSDGDINWLFWVATDNQTPRDKKVYEEFFLTLTVPQGTFAIKIKDWGKFAAFRNNSSIWQSNNIKKGGSLKLLTDTYSSIGHNGSFIQMQNALLELFRDFNAGIGLYEANNDLSGWSELELAPAGASNNDEEPTKKPCQ